MVDGGLGSTLVPFGGVRKITRRLIVGGGVLALGTAGCLLFSDTDGLSTPDGPRPDGASTSPDALPTGDSSDPPDTGGSPGDGCTCPSGTTCAADGCELPDPSACGQAFVLREKEPVVVTICPEDPKFVVQCDGGGPRPSAFFKVGTEAIWKFEIVGTAPISITTLFDCNSPANCGSGGNRATGTFQPGRTVAVSNEGTLCNRVKVAIERNP